MKKSTCDLGPVSCYQTVSVTTDHTLEPKLFTRQSRVFRAPVKFTLHVPSLISTHPPPPLGFMLSENTTHSHKLKQFTLSALAPRKECVLAVWVPKFVHLQLQCLTVFVHF